MSKSFFGIGVAVISPFKVDGSIDFKALERVVENIIKGGVSYLVLLGTTSETVTLSVAEREAVVSYIKEINNGRLPLVLGISSNSTREVVSTIQNTDFEGIDGILSVTPSYNKPGQKGIFQHFKAISNASSVPIILYNVPSRTSSNISAETCLNLAWEFDNIVAIKEASGNLNQVMHIVNNKPPNFQVISGDDLLALPMIALGCKGVISVLANAFPTDWVEMVTLALKSKIKQATEIHYKYFEMIELIFDDGNPAGIKSALSAMNICNSTVRLPLTPATRNTANKISSLVEDLRIK